MESLPNNNSCIISPSTMNGWEEKVALVVGVTGVVGTCLAEILTRCPPGEWKSVHGIARRPRPPWFQEKYPSLDYIQCDLLDRDLTFAKLGPSSSSSQIGMGRIITHVFYVAWVSCDKEEENCRQNGAMLRNLLDALFATAPCCSSRVTHVCLQTGIKHYIGSHLAFDEIHGRHKHVYVEDEPRLSEPNFYYVQEDILFKSIECLNASRGQKTMLPTSWSVHRPGLVFGFSPDALVNSALTLAIYASICKEEGLPLVFTGTRLTWDFHLEAVDASLVAAQEIWAATHACGHNEAFNISNGDNMRWHELWVFIAEYFGLVVATQFEEGKGEAPSLVEWMQSKSEVWDRIVREQCLYPSHMSSFLNGLWVLDIVLKKMPSGKCSMKKSVRHGFFEARDTKLSLFSMFQRMKEMRLIPF